MTRKLPGEFNTTGRIGGMLKCLAVVCLLAGGIGHAAAAQAQGLCESHPIENRFTGLGGEHSSISEGTAIRSVPQLQESFSKYEPELRKVLAEQGRGDVADALFSSVASGEGISETTVKPGDSFKWMAFRRKGEAVSVAPVCLQTDQSYEAYRIEVPVTQDGRTEIYEFIAPKVCLNLAYVGSRTMAECRVGAPAEAGAGEPFEVSMSGAQYDASLTIENEEGEVIRTVAPPFPSQVTIDQPGVYTLKGAVSNKAGDTSRCEARVVVKQSTSWTIRPFAAVVNTSDDEIVNRTTRARRANGGDAGFLQTTFQTHNGFGGGLGVEYHFNEKWGMEARLVISFPEARLKADTTTQWLHDTDDLDLTSVTVGPNYHFYRGERVDLFAGPYVGYTSIGDVSLRVDRLGVRQERSFEDEFVWGGQLGADIKVFKQSPWKLHLGVMYSDLAAKDEDTGEKVDINPWQFIGGVARDF